MCVCVWTFVILVKNNNRTKKIEKNFNCKNNRTHTITKKTLEQVQLKETIKNTFFFSSLSSWTWFKINNIIVVERSEIKKKEVIIYFLNLKYNFKVVQNDYNKIHFIPCQYDVIQ